MNRKLSALMITGVMMLCVVCGFRAATAASESSEQPAGRQIFLNYCASCHGLEGHGNGLVAPSLRKRPSDLTRIRKKDGRFPAEQVRKYITGETVLPVHGEREMPVWGSVLREPELTSLVKYLESIQRFPDLYPDR
ncbi:MAG TPA: c-type cytochrome [Blastocatellia bacterium]|nr:c-type cytochrome [Blastocatellia bacterium]